MADGQMKAQWRSLFVAALAAIAVTVGCENSFSTLNAATLPAPMREFLPREVRIHPFTGARVFGEDGGIQGIDLRIETIDGFGDANKAFGTFRFELFRFAPDRADPKGDRIMMWNEDLTDPKTNRIHWDAMSRTYQFKLVWSQSIAIGQKFVLLATFEDPWGPRVFDQRTFMAGE
jgi:hypothetical protein